VKEYSRVYPSTRVPCWHCSKSLTRVTAGVHAGRYVAAVGVVDGHERVMHVACAEADGPWDAVLSEKGDA
jgi:hypothetical protein